MIKLLIADDEPLVCVGLQSMLDWRRFDIEIVGTARNGGQALEMIERLRPDIVISDIKMPIKSGLEVAAECREKYGRLPLFLFLTSYEEFALVRSAIQLQACDYLIKLELDAANLEKALRNALEVYRQLRGKETGGEQVSSLREKFFSRLLNDLFEDEQQFLLQARELSLDFSAPLCTVAVFELAGEFSGERMLSLSASALQMTRETLGRSHDCHVVMLDTRRFAALFPLEAENWQAELTEALERNNVLLRNYFSLDVRVAVGYAVEDIRQIAGSYRAACAGVHAAEAGIYFCQNAQALDYQPLRLGLRKAFEELDTQALYDNMTALIESIQPEAYLDAMDMACNLLYMSITLMPGGKESLEDIFAEDADGYRSIYRMHSSEAIQRWLEKLRDGCCGLLRARRQNYKQQLVASVQQYIRANLQKKLSLQEVAAVFGISPSYLSQLFAKTAGLGFVDYIAQERVAAAREMLASGEDKIYEIAEKLGFESAFYFSKVFKKVEGVSPREYKQRLSGE